MPSATAPGRTRRGRRRAAAVLLLALVPRVWAQVPSELPPLEFLGFHPGAPLAEVAEGVGRLGGGKLQCTRAKRDHSVMECRAGFSDPVSNRPLSLWVSAVDSQSAILMVSGPVNSEQLTEWKDSLLVRFGEVGAQVQGIQWMMQWVRQGRMLRLTWRIERQEKVASISLVDGQVLDSWGKKRFGEVAKPAKAGE
jgi:hypothetical protein